MRQFITNGIVLSRVNFGEADRVLTVLTSDYGKLHLIAKGVRRIKSKLAGGIELFSTNNITFIYGRGDMGTLISARLVQHFGSIVNDIGRVQLGYEIIQLLNRVTEDNLSADYYDLLMDSLQALDNPNIDENLVRIWFSAQLLMIGGHSPNLHTNQTGQKLDITGRYDFNFESMTFISHQDGQFTANHIKFLRLVFSRLPLHHLQQVKGLSQLLTVCSPVVVAMMNNVVQV